MLKTSMAIALGIPATLYIVLCLLLRLRQTKLIFFPNSQVKSTPQAYGLDYQDVWLTIGTERVHGCWIPATKSNAPALLYFHGNSSNNGDLNELAAIFYRLEVSVLLIDYRGYGKSSPIFPSESRAYEDAVAAWQYLTQVQQIEPERIFVYGHSLGGAIAIELATRHPEMAGLITEGTFTSIIDMAKLMPGIKLFPLGWLVTQRFDSIAKIKSLRVPVLIIHGTADEVIPLSMSHELYQTAPELKQLEIIEGAGHNDLPELNVDEYLQTLDRFIQGTVSREQ